MTGRIFKELLRRPTGLSALCVLCLLYLAAIFAGFLAPYTTNEQNLTQTYHPPTKIFWHNGGLHAQAYERIDPSTAEYRAIDGQSYPIGFFVEGFPYKLFGLFSVKTHLFGISETAAGPPAAGPTKPTMATAEDTTADDTPAASATTTSTATTSAATANANADAAAVQPQSAAIDGEAAPAPRPRIYLLGSDSTGRDVFSRLLYGSRISLTIGLVGISITTALGFLIGGLSGYFGGRFDFVAMRGVEFLMAIPGLYLLLALRSALAPYFVQFGSDAMFLLIVAILSLIGWAGAARVLRGLSLSLSRQQFVLAAESMGQRPLAILCKHILPNLASYLLVAAMLSIPGYILGEAALSFLGLGIQEPAASWGLMLSQTQDVKVFYLNFWWLLSPGAAIVVTVMAFNVLGNSLRDIIAPK